MADKKTPEFSGSAPTGKTREFSVTVIKTVTMTIDTSVIAQGLLRDNPIFGSQLTGDVRQDERIVLEHLAYNLVGNNLALSSIEGYGNCPNESAGVTYEPGDIDWLEEIKIKKPAKRRKA
jgi:hypothetical protein